MKHIGRAVSLIVCLCATWPAAAADKPLVVELWPGKAPDEAGDIGPEKVRMSPKHTPKEVEVTEPTRLVTNVSKPTLTIYRPAKDKDTGDGRADLPRRRLLEPLLAAGRRGGRGLAEFARA